jgi:hypothetical protein
MANMENNVEQQTSSSESTNVEDGSMEGTSTHKSRELLRHGNRKREHEIVPETAESGATPNKNACQPPSPTFKSRSRSRDGDPRHQVQTSNANLAAIMKPPDSNQQHRIAMNQASTSGSLKSCNTDQRLDGQTDSVKVQHKTKQDVTTHILPTANQQDTTKENGTTSNVASNSVTVGQHDTTDKDAQTNSATELRTIIDGLSKSLPSDKLQYKLDIQLPLVNEWVAELHDKLKGDLGWPDLSRMDVVANRNAFVDLPTKLLAEKLNWLLRSREEALQSIMKWQTAPPTISVLPHWMLFPKFTQRTDFSSNIHRYCAQFEQAYVKQITVHFIECFRNIQGEIDAITNVRPECIALLTSEQQTGLHDKQSKRTARLSQIKSANAKPSSSTSSRLAKSSSNMNATSSINATSANNRTATASNNAPTADSMIATSSKNATSINDNVAMDTAPVGAQSDNSVNKPAAPWPGTPNAQRRRRGNSSRRYQSNRYAPSQGNAPQTGRPIYNRQFWNSNYYNNSNRQQPWTHYNYRRPQYGPFRYPNYYNSYNNGGGYYRYSSAGRNHNYRPPWPNHNYEHRLPSNRYDYAQHGIYETQHRGNGAIWHPYGDYKSYGGYSY